MNHRILAVGRCCWSFLVDTDPLSAIAIVAAVVLSAGLGSLGWSLLPLVIGWVGYLFTSRIRDRLGRRATVGSRAVRSPRRITAVRSPTHPPMK
jgi:hypothetical protein